MFKVAFQIFNTRNKLGNLQQCSSDVNAKICQQLSRLTQLGHLSVGKHITSENSSRSMVSGSGVAWWFWSVSWCLTTQGKHGVPYLNPIITLLIFSFQQKSHQLMLSFISLICLPKMYCKQHSGQSNLTHGVSVSVTTCKSDCLRSPSMFQPRLCL